MASERQSKCGIVIGRYSSEIGEGVATVFPDELPTGEFDAVLNREIDYQDLIDVLVAETAPLRVWRSCAVSTHL